MVRTYAHLSVTLLLNEAYHKTKGRTYANNG